MYDIKLNTGLDIAYKTKYSCFEFSRGHQANKVKGIRIGKKVVMT